MGATCGCADKEDTHQEISTDPVSRISYFIPQFTIQNRNSIFFISSGPMKSNILLIFLEKIG
jgi:hypothetical protein